MRHESNPARSPSRGGARTSAHDVAPPPPGTPSKAQFFALVECMTLMNQFSMPADRVLSQVFRAMKSLTARERAKVADVAYAWLRQLEGFREKYPAHAPRRWAIAALHEYAKLSVPASTFHGSKGDGAWLQERLNAPMRAMTAAQLHECPQWLWEKLVAQRGEAEAARLMHALNQSAPFDLRVNSLKAKRDDVLAALKADNIEATPTPLSPYGVRIAQPIALTMHPLFVSGAVEVQDEGSQLLSLLVAPKRAEMVADFCAGAGGKTLMLGALMASTGRLYAMDVDEARLKKLGPRMTRAGLSNVQPMRLDSENDSRLKRLAGRFDRVLVDAPCSGLGTLRRNPDLKWRQTLAGVAEMNVKQAAILAAAAKLVKPGGRLVYATCSLLHEENDAIVDAFLASHAEFSQISAQDLLRVAGVEGERLQLNPATHATDGFFACVMQRAAVQQDAP